MRYRRLGACRSGTAVFFILFAVYAHGQQVKPSVPPVEPSALPDAPNPTPPSNTADVPADELQDKRTLGIMPNFRTVSPGEFVLPATVHEKWVTATEDNFDYSALIFGGIIAADAFAGKETPEFHQGAAGYARYYWHTVADQSIQNYLVEFIIPAVGHEDSRYYAMGKDNGGFFKRVGYALSRAVVTRSDAGKPMFNYAQILGSGAAVAISNFYYPAPERTVANGFRNLGQDIGYDSMTFLFHEFWPDISHAVLHSKADVKPSKASQ